MSSRKGKSGTPEAPKVSPARPQEASKGTGARGSKPVKLTPLQKILVANGGIVHHVRKQKMATRSSPKKRIKAE